MQDPNTQVTAVDPRAHRTPVNERGALPDIVQGGMGVAVSQWSLAKEVAQHGGLGIVSGTAIAVVVARRLQDGDPGGHLRRALAALPLPGVGERIVDRYFVEGGIPAEKQYKAVPMWTLKPKRPLIELTVAANFAEVYLAAEGHDGPVGLNLLHKLKMPTPASIYGAMLAGVDVVAMGAGIPRDIPDMIRRLAAHEVYDQAIEVAGERRPDDAYLRFDPAELWTDPKSGVSVEPMTLVPPRFLAIVGSQALALSLARDPETRPDGFVVEAPIAGGHNAPPRGKLRLDDEGQPIYGEKDVADLEAIGSQGLPFWLAGGWGRPGALELARSRGAAGIQVGTAFAVSQESGIEDTLKRSLLDQARRRTASVRTDPLASPTGFPFKVAEMEGTLSELPVREERNRCCDLGFLQTGYRRDDGRIGLRCAAEPVDDYVRKGGDVAETEGRSCLCNGLVATAGFGQKRADGSVEPPILTAGDDLGQVLDLVPFSEDGIRAADVVAALRAPVPVAVG